MSPMPRNPFRGGVRSIAGALASCALAVSVAVGGPALGGAAVLGAGALALAPQQSWAEPVPVGDFMVEGDTSKYSYVDGVLTVNDGADIVISMANDATMPTSDRIVVAENAEATITLDGVHITGKSEFTGVDAVSAIDIANNASLLLRLADSSTNSLRGGNGDTGDGAPGIHLPEKAELAILGSGSLAVAGGAGGYGGTGIGGTNVPGPNLPSESCGTVVILAVGEISISGGESGPGSSPAQDIGAGKAPPEQEGDDGGGIRPTGDGNYVVWGEEALPEHPKSYTIPEGATLTIPKDATLTIPQGATLINNGTITGDGVIGGPGELTGNGVVTVDKNTFQEESVVTLTVDNGAGDVGSAYVPYSTTVALKAKVERASGRALSADDYNTVTFYVGTGDSKKELGTAKAENNEAALSDVQILVEGGWVIGQNTITAEFAGHSHLKPATGTATLSVGKGPQPDPPAAPSDASDITLTSVTLEPVSADPDAVGAVQYGYATGEMPYPHTWQSSTTFDGLTPGTAYTFYARYAENDFYGSSGSSDTGLKVITAPAADAVTIDYINETIHYADTIEVSPDPNFDASFQSGGSITSYIAGRMYMRVAAQGYGDVPLRGVTTIELPLRPPSAEEPKSLSASGEGERDGKIVNLEPNAAYQISADNQTWVDCATDADGVISGLAAGTYKVRTKATPAQFAGVSASVTINVGDAITIIPPTFEPVYVGYDQPAPMRFTILNTSDKDVTMVTLSKTAGETFAIQHIGDLNFVVPAGGSNTSFTVQPPEKWGVGVHTATITAEYGNGQLVEAEVSFTVLPRMYPDIHSEVEPEEGGKDWAPTVTYGNELVVNFNTSYEADDSEEGPGEGVTGERADAGSGADEGPEDSPADPDLVAKGRVGLYLGDELLAGPVAYEGGDIALTYDTRKRGIPVSEKKQELTVVFEGENAPDETYTAEFKLVKAPAAELTVSGDRVEGSTLEAGFPDARDNAGASFQWLRDGEPIAGATGRSYRLTSEDVGHEVTVRATSPWFEGVSASAAHGDKVKPAAPPSEEVPPAGGTDKPTPGDPGDPAPNGGPGGSGLPSTGDPAAAIASAALAGVLATAAGVALARRRNG